MIARRVTWSALANWWDEFWFEEIPPYSYALLRIALGLVGLLGLIGLTPVAMYWPLDSIAAEPGGSLGVKAQIAALGFGTVGGWILFVALIAAFTSLTVGYRTTVAAVACFALSTVQSMWNSLPLSAAHQVLVSLLFCLMWADSGRALSLDWWQGRRRESSFPTRTMWPLQLMRIQIALIYLNSGLWKLFGPTWRDGSAGHDALHVNVFHRFPVGVPDNLEWLVTAATFGTLAWELAFPLLMIHPWTRAIGLVTGVAIHLGLWASLEVGTFSVLMIVSYIAFFEPTTATTLVSILSQRMRRILATTPSVARSALAHSTSPETQIR